jgi:hypothetical protein
MAEQSFELRGSHAVGYGGRARVIGVPRRSWLRKSRAERPSCQQVRHSDMRTDCARAPTQVRLPPQTLRRMSPMRTAPGAPPRNLDQQTQEGTAIAPPPGPTPSVRSSELCLLRSSRPTRASQCPQRAAGPTHRRKLHRSITGWMGKPHRGGPSMVHLRQGSLKSPAGPCYSPGEPAAHRPGPVWPEAGF